MHLNRPRPQRLAPSLSLAAATLMACAVVMACRQIEAALSLPSAQLDGVILLAVLYWLGSLIGYAVSRRHARRRPSACPPRQFSLRAAIIATAVAAGVLGAVTMF